MADLKQKEKDFIIKVENIKEQYKKSSEEEIKKIIKGLLKQVSDILNTEKKKFSELYSKQENIYISKFNEFSSRIINDSKIIINSINSKIDDLEIKNNKIEEENIELKKEISRFPFTLHENEHIILLIIMTKDEKIMFPLICKNTDKFNKIEEIFFKEFPEYSKNKGKFYYHNNIISKLDDSLEDFHIKTNDIIIFDYE